MNKTFEIQISFREAEIKESVISWLKDQGIESFVEGVIDGLDLDHEFGLPEDNFYEDNGGDLSPIILCSFDEAYISDLHKKLHGEFQEKISIKQVEMDTDSWQNGWKDSFQPIVTDHFRIHPSWEPAPDKDPRIFIQIEPGMAFGTGQHASTQVCLKVLEDLVEKKFDFSRARSLDVGTGSGILAIALAKLGAKHLCATDIDKNAILASRMNAEMNGVDFEILEGTIPSQSFDLIIANILFTVLAPMVPSLSSALRLSGKLILSGLIEEQEEEMIRIAKENDLSVEGRQVVDGWLALRFVKEL